MVWPEGNENWSGGSSVAQQCGSKAQGGCVPSTFLIRRNSSMPVRRGQRRRLAARKRCSPPNSRITAPMAYQSQPSPPRVAQQHPDADPARRRPAIDAAHQPVVAMTRCKSSIAWARVMRPPRPRRTKRTGRLGLRRYRAIHQRAKSFPRHNFRAIPAGHATASGRESATCTDSRRTIGAPICRTSRVSFQYLPSRAAHSSLPSP